MFIFFISVHVINKNLKYIASTVAHTDTHTHTYIYIYTHTYMHIFLSFFYGFSNLALMDERGVGGNQSNALLCK